MLIEIIFISLYTKNIRFAKSILFYNYLSSKQKLNLPYNKYISHESKCSWLIFVCVSLHTNYKSKGYIYVQNKA